MEYPKEDGIVSNFCKWVLHKCEPWLLPLLETKQIDELQ